MVFAVFRCLSVLFLLLSVPRATAQETIVLGVSNATEGPSAQLGLSLNQGAALYFAKYNQHATVTVKMVHMNDGYEPVFTVSNTKRFIENTQSVALFNYVGTPTTAAVLSIIEKSHIPLVTPFTGADFLRSGTSASVFNFRASYQQEAEAQIDYLVNSLNIKNIALVVQADAFGLAAEKYYVQRLATYQLTPSINTRYRRNTIDIKSALQKIKQVKAQAVLFVGTYQPFAELINMAKEEKFSPLFGSVSFIDSHELLSRVDKAQTILVTEVVPDPNHCTLNVCSEFRTLADKEHWSTVNQVQFEGFLNAKLFARVIENCRNVTRQCIDSGYRSRRIDLGGIIVEFDAQGNNRAAQIYATQRNLPKEFMH